MRLPFRKPWRAFEEFDALSDEECRRLLRDASTQRRMFVSVLPALAAMLAGGAWIVFVPVALRNGWVGVWMVPSTSAGRVVAMVVSTVLVVSAAALGSRDWALRRTLRREIDRVRCPRCDQSLAGLRIEYTGLDPHAPGATWVRCPECGRKWVLMDIGLTARDLVPWEQRGVPENFGSKR